MFALSFAGVAVGSDFVWYATCGFGALVPAHAFTASLFWKCYFFEAWLILLEAALMATVCCCVSLYNCVMCWLVRLMQVVPKLFPALARNLHYSWLSVVMQLVGVMELPTFWLVQFPSPFQFGFLRLAWLGRCSL